MRTTRRAATRQPIVVGLALCAGGVNLGGVSKSSDIRVIGARVHLLPIPTRVPLKFGTETLSHVTCARAQVRVRRAAGGWVEGWGETPLSVQWGWPSSLPYETRLGAMVELTRRMAKAWCSSSDEGHAMEIGWRFVENVLPGLWSSLNHERGGEAMPWLAALICASVFDQAIHDAYGHAVERPVYDTYDGNWMNWDLSAFLDDEGGSAFRGRYPADFLSAPRLRMPAWHLVGGVDPVSQDELTGAEPNDGHPVLLEDWIRRDGLKCLKVKLRGNNLEWDFGRLVAVGNLGIATGVDWLSADFNCTVHNPAYVNEILDRIRDEHPRIFGMLLYVEQPFPYELEVHRIDAHGVSARKPLFLDESAHDWRFVRMGRDLGWTGVALKTCKTQSGALLSMCWAKSRGMTLMVQDLTNPMLAQLAHLQLAAHAGTIMGVETNGMQFYPDASLPEARVHPGCYRRIGGCVDLSTLGGNGFRYRMHEMDRQLPPPLLAEGDIG